ncbi:hypothetical protein POX_b02542 [Penicillium oxalicum]|uniref:hypothetical protein n=1 Tax=Penicillium oxalicum TaxID=69781 RepID=UPI0020B68989|nr:hypothetical protein POX_b02542 [Penicillium oxalicum]KAI2792504.1 hypothetical protein POX_b02542 [Penicillium oxalicum]
MRSPRLLLILFSLVFFPIFLTIFSALSSPTVSTSQTLSGRTSGLHALFSFNIPSSLFPPSAIISLTDDNSTFFLARPAAFGPLLPRKGLSGKLWVGSGFGEGSLISGTEGELGCSDIPGWGENIRAKAHDSAGKGAMQKSGKSGSGAVGEAPILQSRAYLASQVDSARQMERRETVASTAVDDGTDDHLHQSLTDPTVLNIKQAPTYGETLPVKQSSHADIQSLQETAEIQGNVVLLSRGGCGFLEKVMWAQRRGAIAVIVGDDTRGGNLVTMYARGDTSNATIPAIFTSYTTAHLLSSLIPSHSGAVAGLGSKSSHPTSAGRTNVDSEKPAALPSILASTAPSSTSPSASKEHSAAGVSHPKGGVFCALGSFLGLCSESGGPPRPSDSRRPPSSGNIDWLVPGALEAKEPSSSSSRHGTESNRRGSSKTDATLKPKKFELSEEEDDMSDEEFIIGVQDWRDSDLLAPKDEGRPLPSTTPHDDPNSQDLRADQGPSSPSNSLLGGSITPGSGEYQSIDKLTGNSRVGTTHTQNNPSTSAAVSTSSGKGWFSSHFSWGHDHEQSVQPSTASALRKVSEGQKNPSPSWLDSETPMASDHEGLWVTLSPTSVSASPFFDTLLVLVVSPLLTLTMVYGLLLLRSRIRRRRWRAPKSVVERLPVRTYHTIARTPSSSSSESLRPASPGPVSPSSPLLSHPSRSDRPRLARSRSQTVAGVITDSTSLPKEEKLASSQTGSTLWRRKYTGRQVECVVCLEEYVDGQSRVMSLPCGHEFHAECITPWLTTRRRTCPICKGDVVRSLGHSRAAELDDQDEQSGNSLSQERNEGPAQSAEVPISNGHGDGDSDDEQSVGLITGQPASTSNSSWRNFASFSFSALGGDNIWHQARADRNR